MFDYCFSMLLPLETLPGWPEAPDPSLGALLLVILVVPAAISLVIVLLGMGPTWYRRARGLPEPSAELAVPPAD